MEPCEARSAITVAQWTAAFFHALNRPIPTDPDCSGCLLVVAVDKVWTVQIADRQVEISETFTPYADAWLMLDEVPNAPPRLVVLKNEPYAERVLKHARENLEETKTWLSTRS